MTTTTGDLTLAGLGGEHCDLCLALTDDSALCERCAPVYEAKRLLDPDEVIVDAARAIAEIQQLGRVTASDIDQAIPLALAALRIVVERVARLVDLLPALAAAEAH